MNCFVSYCGCYNLQSIWGEQMQVNWKNYIHIAIYVKIHILLNAYRLNIKYIILNMYIFLYT